MPRALVLFSGGQDSTTCLHWAKKRFEDVQAISFSYGQRHAVELELAELICQKNRLPWHRVDLAFLNSLNSNALVSEKIETREDGGFNNLPSTFVPGRNALFLTVAASFAIPRKIDSLVIGAGQVDYSGYPDCREDFIRSQEQTLSLALGSPLKIHAPLMDLSKSEIFSLARELGCLEEVLEDSHTCYKGERSTKHVWGYGCGTCPACVLRKNGYKQFNKEAQHADSRG